MDTSWRWKASRLGAQQSGRERRLARSPSPPPPHPKCLQPASKQQLFKDEVQLSEAHTLAELGIEDDQVLGLVLQQEGAVQEGRDWTAEPAGGRPPWGAWCTVRVHERSTCSSNLIADRRAVHCRVQMEAGKALTSRSTTSPWGKARIDVAREEAKWAFRPCWPCAARAGGRRCRRRQACD